MCDKISIPAILSALGSIATGHVLAETLSPAMRETLVSRGFAIVYDRSVFASGTGLEFLDTVVMCGSWAQSMSELVAEIAELSEAEIVLMMRIMETKLSSAMRIGASDAPEVRALSAVRDSLSRAASLPWVPSC